MQRLDIPGRPQVSRTFTGIVDDIVLGCNVVGQRIVIDVPFYEGNVGVVDSIVGDGQLVVCTPGPAELQVYSNLLAVDIPTLFAEVGGGVDFSPSSSLPRPHTISIGHQNMAVTW